jgi:cytochrome c-type biogenesis protein CcmE
MRFVYHSMASRPLIIVTATLLVMIAISVGLSFFITNNAIAQMTGNMNSMMRTGGMMGMGPGMMGMVLA